MIAKYRYGLYLLGGALILTWAAPPKGLMSGALSFMLIVAGALLDHFLIKRGKMQQSSNPNVLSMSSFKASRSKRQTSPSGNRERRVLHPVFSSPFHGEVQALMNLLRSEGLSPIMLSSKAEGTLENALYEVRLPEKEVQQAKPLIMLFQIKSANKPS